jgi:hypothetical protein
MGAHGEANWNAKHVMIVAEPNSIVIDAGSWRSPKSARHELLPQGRAFASVMPLRT